jgi:alpha-beta hydrolase superfamily lysophospholipase
VANHRTDLRDPRPDLAAAPARRAPLLALVIAGAAFLAGSDVPSARADLPAVAASLVRLSTGDAKETTGVLSLPSGRPPRAGVVIVHGYGGDTSSGVPGWLGGALGERGFAALAVNLRDHGTAPKTTPFEEGRWDVLAAVDELGRRGFEPIAVVGHSLGTNTVLHVAAEARDPRLRALVLIAGPGNAFEWNVRLFGQERAAAVLEDALRLQAAGRGRELMRVNLGPLGWAVYSADHLVSLRGPATRSDPYRNAAVVTVPILIVHAGADRLVDPDVARRLRAAATAAPRVDLVEVLGADHGFSGHQAALADIVERWLAETLGR